MYKRVVSSKYFRFAMIIMMVAAIGCTFVIGCSASDTSEVANAIAASETVFTEVKSVFNVANITTIIASAAGASVALVLMWFGVRKLVNVLMTAFRSGRISM